MSTSRKPHLDTPYLRAASNALESYKGQSKRDGDSRPGFFSFIRHGGTAAPDELISNLQKAESLDDAYDYVLSHFTHNKTWNDHSYNSYLYDELIKLIPEVNWDHHNPALPARFQGTFYVAVPGDVDINYIFKNGLKDPTPRFSLRDYILPRSFGSVTTKAGTNGSLTEEGAAADLLPDDFISRTKQTITRVPDPIYVLEINYRGGKGFDLGKTQKNNASHSYAEQMHHKIFPMTGRVSIKGKIEPQDIAAYRLWQRKDGKLECDPAKHDNEKYWDPRRDKEPLVPIHKLFSEEQPEKLALKPESLVIKLKKN